MEKFFRPNKYLVLFCALFILVCGLYQLVASLRLSDMAKTTGAEVFTWYWPAYHLRSQALITEAAILRKSEMDAVVKIKGNQTLLSDDKTRLSQLDAILTFYRASNHWVLGKVELQ